MTKRIDERAYSDLFKLDTALQDGPNGVASSALKFALETRKFEIELYWERAKYFWTFIAATLAGFAVVQKLNPDDRTTFLSVILSCLGVLFSLAWYLVNRGSKLWQENWENHVALLEEKVHGPLLKTILVREQRWTPKSFLIGPARYSVSGINQIVSLFVTLFWAFLVYYACPKPIVWSWDAIDWTLARPILLTLGACVFLLWWGRSDFRGEKNSQPDQPKADHLLKAMQYTTAIDRRSDLSITVEGPVNATAYDAIVRAWNLTVKARALCPHSGDTAVGLIGYVSPPWYRDRGAVYFVDLAQKLTLGDVRELNEIGTFINRSFVISMAAILEAYGVVPYQTDPDRSRKGGNHVQLVKWLRNRFAHGHWDFDAGNKVHAETRDLLASLFPEAAAKADGFVVSIDEILEPLKDGVLEYIRATPR